ncbi:MAG: FecR family protein [Crocinitomicaceae bacterium TMED209]|nr:MAG: FecR family protein [Crocinitomicaceae bacterium TMED209]
MDAKIQKLIVKYLSKEANIYEIEELDRWLIKKGNIAIFNNYVQTDYYTSIFLTKYNLQTAKSRIQMRIRLIEKRNKLERFKKLAFAASVSLLIGISLFNQFNFDQTKMINDPIVIGTDKAVLTLENGDQVILEKGKKFQNNNINSNGIELSYSTKNRSSINFVDEKIASNFLTVPRGGQFSLNLEDGTKVLLNSDSKIKYPVKFIKGKKRQVELLYGEAFFEVSSSKNNNGSEFIVSTKSQKINVLGTKFNIKAYNEDNVITTTLVEGKVKVENGKNQILLLPNQQSKVDSKSTNIIVSDIDVFQQISWISGLFSFNDTSLENIMNTLSRWYDLEFVFKSANKKNLIFSGILERTKSIEDILFIIEKTSSSNEINFKIVDKVIIVE